MTETLFLDDAYLRDAEARVTAITPEGGIVCDRTVFYATGGGQPGEFAHFGDGDGRCLRNGHLMGPPCLRETGFAHDG